MFLYEMYASFEIQVTAAKWKIFAYVPCILGDWKMIETRKKNLENNKGFESISWQPKWNYEQRDVIYHNKYIRI